MAQSIFPRYISSLRRLGTAACLASLLVVACLSPAAALASGLGSRENFTGLPLYPRLDAAEMDPYTHTDTLGRWCMRFDAVTSDGLDAVQSWYRRAMRGSSETDLGNDRDHVLGARSNVNYGARSAGGSPAVVGKLISGIKLAVGIDYAAIYRTAGAASTLIELVRCSPRG